MRKWPPIRNNPDEKDVYETRSKLYSPTKKTGRFERTGQIADCLSSRQEEGANNDLANP